MAHRRIGQERFGFAVSRGCCSLLDERSRLIDWHPLAGLLKPIHASAKGEAARSPLAMFKAHAGADADTALVEGLQSVPPTATMARDMSQGQEAAAKGGAYGSVFAS